MTEVEKQAQLLAARLASALAQDGFTKQASVTPAAVRTSQTLQVLKEAEERLETMGATEDEIEEIADTAADKIRGRRGYLRRMMKESSNDNYVSVADFIDQILGKK